MEPWSNVSNIEIPAVQTVVQQLTSFVTPLEVVVVTRLCMSCGKRPGTIEGRNAKGKKQYRCEICAARQNRSGLSNNSK